jgi:hypothetical protein
VPADPRTITIRCPNCGRTVNAPRWDEFDPRNGTLCLAWCGTCSAGKGLKTTLVGYYDESGNEVSNDVA